LRATARRLEAGKIDRTEAASPVTSHHHPGKVAVRLIAEDDTEDALRSVLEPCQLLSERVGERLAGVSGQRVEPDTG